MKDRMVQLQSWISGLRLRTSPIALALLTALLARGGLAVPSAQAQTFSVLYSFAGTTGGGASAVLIRDTAGNFYGSAYYGGANGDGTIFKVDKVGVETTLHSFTGGTDGANPGASLIRDSAGNLYGTTENGGNTLCPSGCGTVFKLNKRGQETVVGRFTGQPDGATPLAGLVVKAGNFYGTTKQGGAHGFGTVFKIDTTGKETVVHSFTGGRDGAYPYAGLIQGATGSLYGTTSSGGDLNCDSGFGCGTVFELDANGTESVLYSFTGGVNGRNPVAGLVLDASGNFYGTTYYGGDLACGGFGYGCGTVFKLDSTGKETALYSFTGGTDGSTPEAGLVLDPAGHLYGTTYYGGPNGLGTIFRVDLTGRETVLHSFTGKADGKNPVAGLIRDAAGHLYGVTYNGGAFGFGVVFKLTP